MATMYEVEQWLDMQIEARRMMNIPLTIEKHDDGIDDELTNFSRTADIHIGGDAVRYIADLLRLTLCVRGRKTDKKNPYEVFVIYKGEVFFGIETEEEYRERGAVV